LFARLVVIFVFVALAILFVVVSSRVVWCLPVSFLLFNGIIASILVAFAPSFEITISFVAFAVALVVRTLFHSSDCAISFCCPLVRG
jgi:hypothetical protein